MKSYPMGSSLTRTGVAAVLASIAFGYGVNAAAQALPESPPPAEKPASPGAPAAAGPAAPGEAEAAPVEAAAAPAGTEVSGAPAAGKAAPGSPTSQPGEPLPMAAEPPPQPPATEAPAQPPMGAAGTNAEAGMSTEDAEAAALEAELLGGGGGGASEVVEDLTEDEADLSIYGFADFTYSHLFSDRHAFNVQTPPYNSFYVGNLNVYLDSKLGANWRALSEVRFTYLPDGAEVTDYETGATTRTSSTYPNYADFSRPVDVGGIIIERAWLEYMAHPLLTVRAGHWLTPYGIWNVDHGSTVIVGTTRPYIVGNEMFPASQTGLQLYGTYGIAATQIGYNLTLSNGRGPVDKYKDWDKNKAVGWRVWAQQDTDVGAFVLGTSGYRGNYTDRGVTSVLDATSGEFEWDYPLNEEYKELNIAADFKWTWGGALFQGEFIVHDVGYMDDTRPAVPFVMDGGPAGQTADRREWGMYAIAGYRFGFLGIMPFFGGEYIDFSKTSFSPNAVGLWGGLNVRPTARVVIKAQGTYAFFPDDFVGFEKPDALKLLTVQLAWSF